MCKLLCSISFIRGGQKGIEHAPTQVDGAKDCAYYACLTCEAEGAVTPQIGGFTKP